MNAYKLTYHDGDIQYTRMNANFEEAKEYFLNQIFTFWNEEIQREGYRKVVNIEQL